MKLYYSPGACSLAPHIIMHEAGLKGEMIKVNLKTHKTEDGKDFYTINPKGYVPVLELDNGEKLTEGVAIDLYLAKQFPTTELAPAEGSMEYFRLLEWLLFITTELHKSFGPLFFDAGEKAKEVYTKRLISRFEYASNQLGSKSYLLGEKFSLADIYFFVVLNWAHKLKLDLTKCPNLEPYRNRIAARPHVIEAMKMEGII